jgi:tripartite-type tricarboxylate transporter receptor subunit TctC
VAHPTLGVHSIHELVALARSGAPIDYVSPGVGTLGHLLVENFAQKTGIAVQHIPHKGSAQAMLDLIAGTVKVGTMTFSSAAGQIRAGTLIPLAVSSNARVAEFPDVPTLREEGFDLVALTWFALSGPAGLPDDIVTKLNRAVNEAWALPEVERRLAADAIATEAMTPQQVTNFVTDEVRKWGPLAKRVVQNP